MMRGARGISFLELLVLLLLAVLLCALLLPVLATARERARRTRCAKNLSALGCAMMMYADVPAHNGLFPSNSVRQTDPFAADALLSLGLLQRAYVSDWRVFQCDSDPAVASRAVPADTSVHPLLTRRTCSYGYDPGHSQQDVIVAIVSDKRAAGRWASHNHGVGAGQNVLCGAGTVEFTAGATQQVGDGLVDASIFARDEQLPRHQDAYIRP